MISKRDFSWTPDKKEVTVVLTQKQHWKTPELLEQLKNMQQQHKGINQTLAQQPKPIELTKEEEVLKKKLDRIMQFNAYQKAKVNIEMLTKQGVQLDKDLSELVKLLRDKLKVLKTKKEIVEELDHGKNNASK